MLGHFQRKQAGDVIEAIVVKLGQLVPRSLRRKRYIKQLEILAKLRNLQELTILLSEKMALIYDLETDIRFKQGVDRGLERGLEKGVDPMIGKMIRRGTLSHQEIADIAAISLEHVTAIARQISQSA